MFKSLLKLPALSKHVSRTLSPPPSQEDSDVRNGTTFFCGSTYFLFQAPAWTKLNNVCIPPLLSELWWSSGALVGSKALRDKSQCQCHWSKRYALSCGLQSMVHTGWIQSIPSLGSFQVSLLHPCPSRMHRKLSALLRPHLAQEILLEALSTLAFHVAISSLGSCSLPSDIVLPEKSTLVPSTPASQRTSLGFATYPRAHALEAGTAPHLLPVKISTFTVLPPCLPSPYELGNPFSHLRWEALLSLTIFLPNLWPTRPRVVLVFLRT